MYSASVVALPNAYLTTSKNLGGILSAMQTAQAPKKFTLRFLEGLGYKSSSDRLIINVLKSLGFLTSAGQPTQRYFEYLDQTQSERVMAEAIRDAYQDVYEVHRRAHELSRNELKNKLRTLSQGQHSESVLDKMAMTIKGLAEHADFEAAEERPPPPDGDGADQGDQDGDRVPPSPAGDEGGLPGSAPVRLGGLVYNIQIQLPESRDQAVYDALFRSLKTHLLE
jgi:hypothetical protein